MLWLTAATHINPKALHSSPAFSQVVRVSADTDTIYVGGQNGIGADGAVVGTGMAEQTRQAFANLRTCLEAAGAEVTDIVKWTISYVEGADVHAGLAAFDEFWPRDAAPPVITVAKVSDVGPPRALVEIEAGRRCGTNAARRLRSGRRQFGHKGRPMANATVAARSESSLAVAMR